MVGYLFNVRGAAEGGQGPAGGRCDLDQAHAEARHAWTAPVTVGQVAFLQTTVVNEGDDVEWLLAGTAAIMVAVRLRFADAQYAVEEPSLGVDSDGKGFAELKLGSVKHARTADLVKVEKVAVGFALGLNGTPWVREWIALRGEVGA